MALPIILVILSLVPTGTPGVDPDSLLSAHVQETCTLEEKYDFYRERLKADFLQLGLGDGLSIPASARARKGSAGSYVHRLHWGDATNHLGWYIGMLATEYNIRRSRWQSVDATVMELFAAVAAVERLDVQAETLPPWNDKPARNGFFVRDDVACEFLEDKASLVAATHVRYPVSDDVESDRCTTGHERDKEMSQDQVIHLLLGLSLVKRYVPDAELRAGPILRQNIHKLASDAAVRIINRTRAGGSWKIKNPDGDEVRRGHNATAYAAPLLYARSWFEGSGDPSVGLFSRNLWNAQSQAANPNEDNNHMSATLAAISDSWRNLLGKNNTRDGIRRVTNGHNWEIFYMNLHAALHDGDLQQRDQLETELERAPCDGPENLPGVSVTAGWAAPLKFTHDWSQQVGGAGLQGEYNGIDYMLAFNLYTILNEGYGPTSDCSASVEYDGKQTAASFDGANCFVAKLSGAPLKDFFLYQNALYVTSVPGNTCEIGQWDSANCWVMNKPKGGFIYQNGFYTTTKTPGQCTMGSWDGANCLIQKAPWGTKAFEYKGSFYVSAKPHCRLGAFDGANCLVAPVVPPAKAFIYQGGFYYSNI